jgi:hypothetical protein
VGNFVQLRPIIGVKIGRLDRALHDGGIASDRSEHLFDGRFDTKDRGEKHGAVGRKTSNSQPPEVKDRQEKTGSEKIVVPRNRVTLLKPLSTGAPEHIGAVIRARITHRFPGRGKN